jgi:hypothetical protein
MRPRRRSSAHDLNGGVVVEVVDHERDERVPERRGDGAQGGADQLLFEVDRQDDGDAGRAGGLSQR